MPDDISNQSSDLTNYQLNREEKVPEGAAEYTAKDLEHLSDLEHVRERPSMYIGDTTQRGLHHLVYEVVDNSIDEAMAGYASEVSVIINVDGSVTVEDNGARDTGRASRRPRFFDFARGYDRSKIRRKI